MNNQTKPIAISKNMVVQSAEPELLIYNLETNQAYCLNATSARVWEMCDGENSISGISRKLSVSQKELISEDLVWLAINELDRFNLLEKDELQMTEFSGKSRRELIRRVGLASLIALPVISSIVAPISAEAASVAVCVGSGTRAPGTVLLFAPCGSLPFPNCVSFCTTFGSACCSGASALAAATCPTGCFCGCV